MTKTPSQPKPAIQATDVARMQSRVAKRFDGRIPKDNYVARLQRVVAVQTAPKKTN